jgi:pyrroloquinoline-quinone synthase
MNFWDRLDTVADRWNVLRHPFYVRWSAGELTREELALYSGQYRHAVAALAVATRQAGNEEHAAEEKAHVELWDEFAGAVGGDAAAPLPETANCARAWADPDRSQLASLVALYAIESAQPAISKTKRAGLVEHYGFEPGPATRYFDVHVERDVEHAAEGRAAIESRLGDSQREGDEGDGALIAAAETALSANWRLLDGVERACAAAA